MMYSIKTRKIRRNKIRLHNWSVKEHQERGSDLISSGYVSRLSSQLEMRSEGHCFLHWISLMWKFQDVKFIKKSCVLLCSVRCLVPSERKAPLAPNHEIQESARSSSFHSLLGLLRLQLYLRRDQTKCEIGSRKQAGRSALEDRYRQNLIVNSFLIAFVLWKFEIDGGGVMEKDQLPSSLMDRFLLRINEKIVKLRMKGLWSIWSI